MRVLILLMAVLGLAGEEPRQGMDVTPVVRGVVTTLSGPPSQRPWADDLAALTDPDPARHGPAMSALVRHGAPCIPDVDRLSREPDAALRARIAIVAAGIGGAAPADVLLRLSLDENVDVATNAIVGLGRISGSAARQRVRSSLSHGDGAVRAAAAQAVEWNGDLAALPQLISHAHERDALAGAGKRRALIALLLREGAASVLMAELQSVPATAAAGAGAASERISDLLDAVRSNSDPRLAPAIIPYITCDNGWLRMQACLAAEALADARTVPALISVVARDPAEDVRQAAAAALRRITGYTAAAGTAWELWWSEQRTTWHRRDARDALIARLHDPSTTVSSEQLAAFTVEELAPLMFAALRSDDGGACRWFPALALRALRVDGWARWAAWLEASAGAAPENQHSAWVTMIDLLGRAEAVPVLKRLIAKWETGSGVALARTLIRHR